VSEFALEGLSPNQAGGGNKSTAIGLSRAIGIAIFAGASTRPSGKTIFAYAPSGCGHLFRRRERDAPMRRVNSLLRFAPARIGRRLARFVAIAAASLPVAGA
jgi:hypothetical protein